jgi:hypothetical protein
MADVQLGINQGDHIYYYDLSTGGISREWKFPGGTPSTSTVYGPDIRYYGVNYTGYSTGLVVTGAGGITAAAYKPNIIVVYPELFNPAISVTYNGVGITDSPMSRTLHYSVTGTVSSGIDEYNWEIPQLQGIGSPTVDFACTDWYELTGTYVGSPNSSYLANASVDIVSVVGNEVVLDYGINFRKIGVQESINYWNSGTYATSGKYYDFSTLSQRTSSLGLGGNSLVFRIDLAPYSPKWNNTSFHSTQEVVYLWPNSPDVSKTYTPIKTNMILVGSALSTAGATGGYASELRVMSGNYIIPGDISSKFASKFFITDQVSGNLLTTLVDGNRKWENSSVNYFMENKYYLSGSSKFIELGGFYNSGSLGSDPLAKKRPGTIFPYANLATGYGYLNGSGGYAWDGGWAAEDGADPIAWYHGVGVPTGFLFDDLYGYGDQVVDIRLIIRDYEETVIDDFQFVISGSSYSGNSPDSYIILAGESGFGTIHGLAYLINAGITAHGGGLSNNIIFEDNASFAPYRSIPSGIYNNSSFFSALRMSIKDPRTSSTYSNRYIHSLEIMWGDEMSNWITYASENGIDFPCWPLASDIGESYDAMTSWTGLPSKITVPASSYSSYFRGWKIGGALT